MDTTEREVPVYQKPLSKKPEKVPNLEGDPRFNAAYNAPYLRLPLSQCRVECRQCEVWKSGLFVRRRLRRLVKHNLLHCGLDEATRAWTVRGVALRSQWKVPQTPSELLLFGRLGRTSSRWASPTQHYGNTENCAFAIGPACGWIYLRAILVERCWGDS